jgi:hypothetical protein
MSTVLPLIINKDVQLQFSGCGRETRGQKKENFSKTETNQILKGSRYYMDAISTFSTLINLLYIINFLFSVIDIVLEKFSNISGKDYNSYLSRWLSNAVDREGGKKGRLNKKVEEQNK